MTNLPFYMKCPAIMLL
ncbi:hypothetical protein F383_23531 [Gossypium arboreum]|uniref:Uncharacterized protein n=1 Tax=Gossypium arboreum TaxID=29729 RepID=A0A0B0P2J3_GOSAR|nr:hypothetical protein F383_23531 [Gossypium arboreum]